MKEKEEKKISDFETDQKELAEAQAAYQKIIDDNRGKPHSDAVTAELRKALQRKRDAAGQLADVRGGKTVNRQKP